MIDQEIRFFGFTKTGDEIALLYRELAVMAAAGIPIIEGLDTLISESSRGKAKKVLSALKLQLETKDDIETLIIKYPEYYNKAFLYILKNTKPGDEISRFLNNIADELERRYNLKKRMLAAIEYPLVVLSIAVIISLVLLIFVIPVFEDMFASFGSALPAPTQLVVLISDFVKTYILVILIIVAVIFVILFRFKRLLLSLLSHVPFVGKILRKISILQFAGYLSILLGVKVPIKEAVRYAALAIDNPSFSKEIKNMGMQMTDGGSLKEVMKQIPIFPSFMLQAVAVGEKAGRLDYILSEVSGYYSKDVDTSLNALIGSINILTIILLGLVVGGLVIAMYLPIFTMAGAVG
jgi:type IV pilus assembly protein PilC